MVSPGQCWPRAGRRTWSVASRRRMTFRFSTVNTMPRRPQRVPIMMAGPTAATWLASWVCTCRGGQWHTPA